MTDNKIKISYYPLKVIEKNANFPLTCKIHHDLILAK